MRQTKIVDLGPLKGTSGMQDFPVPASADAMTYHARRVVGLGDGPRDPGRAAQVRPEPGGIARTMPAMAFDRSRPILIVDDDAKIVRLIRTYLEREGLRVIEALDGPTALSQVDDEDPALVVLDLMLPGLDGLAVIRAVRDHAETPIIVLSALGTTADRIAGLGLGADDYLPKPFSPAELVLRVKRVLARTGAARPASTSHPQLRFDGLSVDRDRHDVVVDGQPIAVTPVEFRLLVAILEADGRVLSRDQLLGAVYGPDAEGLLDRTIDVHVGRLRDKLGDIATAPRFIATVRGAGYRAVERPTLTEATPSVDAPER